MEEINVMLKEAYLATADQIERGIRVFPTRFRPIWDEMRRNYAAITECGAIDREMYRICYFAGIEYDQKVSRIGIDSAFSSVICEIGISYQSADWYRIMAYHYERRAEDILRRYERDSNEY